MAETRRVEKLGGDQEEIALEARPDRRRSQRSYCESSCALSWRAGIVLVGPNLAPQMGKLNIGGSIIVPSE